MEQYINYLPQELQLRLLDEMPSYGVLSTKQIAGQQYFKNYLCYKNITINEFMNYLNDYKPDKAFVYIEGEQQYIVLEVINKFGFYSTVAHIFDFTTIKVMAKQVSLKTYLHENTNVTFDLVTTSRIYNTRQGCNQLQKYLYQQLYNHINITNNDDNEFINVINHIKKLYYIISNNLILIGEHTLAVLTLKLHQLLRHIYFDNNEYIGDKENLNDFYTYYYNVTYLYKEQIINFIENA